MVSGIHFLSRSITNSSPINALLTTKQCIRMPKASHCKSCNFKFYGLFKMRHCPYWSTDRSTHTLKIQHIRLYNLYLAISNSCLHFCLNDWLIRAPNKVLVLVRGYWGICYIYRQRKSRKKESWRK